MLDIVLENGTVVSKIVWNNLTIVEGRPNTNFSLRLTNNSYKRRLFVPTIDGLSVIDGKSASRKSSGYVLNAHETLDIPGWLINSETCAKFKFGSTKKGKNYVEQLKEMGLEVDPKNQGIIGLVIFEEKHEKTLFRGGYIHSAQPPAYSLVNDLVCSSTCSTTPFSDSSLGTQFGEDTTYHTTATKFERGKIYEEVIIEYDTFDGWIKRGVSENLLRPNKNLKKAFPKDDYCVRPRS